MGREFHVLPHTLRSTPLHWLVWDFLRIREMERVDELVEETDRLRTASLNAMAFNKPKLLGPEKAKLDARIKAFRLLDVHGPDTRTVDELRAVGEALAERVKQSGAYRDVMEAGE